MPIDTPDGIKCVKFPIFALGREFPEVETGSNPTASATTQSPNSPVAETLREMPVLTGLIWHRIFDAESLAGGLAEIGV
jgi:hypothetical protein